MYNTYESVAIHCAPETYFICVKQWTTKEWKIKPQVFDTTQVSENKSRRASITFLYSVYISRLLLSSFTPTYLTRHQTCSRFQNQWGSGPNSRDWTDRSCGGTWRCGCSTAAWLFLERWGLQDLSQHQSLHSEHSRAVARGWGSRCSGGRWARRFLTLPEWSFLKIQRERRNSVTGKLNCLRWAGYTT